MSEQIYFKATDLAARFGVTPRTIHRWRKRGERRLHAIRPGGAYLFHRDVVKRFEDGLRLVGQEGVE